MTRRSTTVRSDVAAVTGVLVGIGLLLAACGSGGPAVARAVGIRHRSNGSTVTTAGHKATAAPAPALGAAAGGSAPTPAIAASSGTAPSGSTSASDPAPESPSGASRAPAASAPPAASTGRAASSGSGGSGSPPASSGGPGGSGFGGGTQTALVSVSGPASVAAAGSPQTYAATLSPPAGDPTPSGSVVFTLSQPGGAPATRLCTDSLHGVQATCAVTFPGGGNWFVDAYFAPGSGSGGSGTYVPSQGSQAVTVRS